MPSRGGFYTLPIGLRGSLSQYPLLRRLRATILGALIRANSQWREISIQWRARNQRYGYLGRFVCHSLSWNGMEIGGRTIAGFGSSSAERLSRYWVTCPYGRSLRVFYGHSLRHFRTGYCDPSQPFVCCRDLRCSPLLRNSLNPALVASEDFRLEVI